MLRAVSQGGPVFRLMVNGPRYVLWKKLLRQATEAGLLADDVDPDAFAIASSQIGLSNVLEWAQGGLTLDEMEARNHYGLALVLLGVCGLLSVVGARLHFEPLLAALAASPRARPLPFANFSRRLRTLQHNFEFVK